MQIDIRGLSEDAYHRTSADRREPTVLRDCAIACGFRLCFIEHPYMTYAYDKNDKMTKRGSDTLTYDYENRLTAYTLGSNTTTFLYDGDGGRVKKTAGGVTNLYIGKLYECVGPCAPSGLTPKEIRTVQGTVQCNGCVSVHSGLTSEKI